MQNALAVVSLKRIVSNALLVRERAKVPLYAVVKDDAYGHGLEAVSLALEPYVRGFAVAKVSEGEALRTAGIAKEILVLTPCLDEEEALLCFAHSLTPSLTSNEALELLCGASRTFSQPLRAQLAINTGMNRYGFPPEDARKIARSVKRSGGTITGVFSHFYEPDDALAREEQFRLFSAAAEEVKREFPDAVRHLSSTGGILAGEKYAFDAVRCGIALYGYLPSGFMGALPVRPAMKLFVTAAQNTRFLGGGICYGKTYETFDSLTTFSLGYGDGFGRDCRIGNIHELCMDAYVQEGSVPFGRRKLLISDFEKYASRHGTIVYEALVSLTRKAEKVYVR